MLIQWRASSQWVVRMSSPSSGGWSLTRCTSEEMWHRIGPLSAKFGVSLHYKYCREESAWRPNQTSSQCRLPGSHPCALTAVVPTRADGDLWVSKRKD